MAFVTTNALCVPAMAAAAPRCSLTITRASAKSPERLEAAAMARSVYAGGRQRRAMTLFSTAVSASRGVIYRSTKANDVSTMPGQGEEIKDVTDPFIQELGKWAVTEYNKNHGEKKLQFDKVVRGEKQLVAGMNYVLVIETKEPYRLYAAEVFVSLPPEKRELKSFAAIAR